MSKRVLIGLFALGVVAFLWTEANAGCAVIAGFQICASWITGGSAIGSVAFEPPAGSPDMTNPACFVAPGGFGEGSGALAALSLPGVDLRLVGTVGQNCGLGATENQSCDINGVAFCAPPSTVAIARHDDEDDVDHQRGIPANVKGPLTVHAEGFSQTDPDARGGAGRSFAGFRFQLPKAEQDRLCPTPMTIPAGTTGGFQTFVPRKGFFEACVTSPGTTTVTRCLREFCAVKIGGPNDAHVYGCKRLDPPSSSP